MDAAIDELVAAGTTRVRACTLTGRSRASHYRAGTKPPVRVPKLWAPQAAGIERG
jgi:hypothetical protein